jgi:hypothetical protein
METMAETNDRLKPDTYSFNTVLKALANSKEKGSVERARSILEKMENKYANGDDSAKPDAITYVSETLFLVYRENTCPILTLKTFSSCAQNRIL